MMYTAKVTVRSEIHTKHSTQGDHHVEFLNIKPGGRVQFKRDGTRWRTGGEVKGKLANGVGSQYPSHYLGTWCIEH